MIHGQVLPHSTVLKHVINTHITLGPIIQKKDFMSEFQVVIQKVGDLNPKIIIMTNILVFLNDPPINFP